LLFKFLDANKMLSVQVHPNDEQASQLDPPDLGKTEAWLILAAELGSCLYAGLREGTTRADFHNALRQGTVEECLNRIEPRVGDCIFIPAGTVHALGSGLVVAEIQQASDTTFRLFDWNRLDANGNPRALHIEQGLAVTDFNRGPVTPQVDSKEASTETLVECDKFVMRRHTVQKSITVGGDDRCHIVVVVDGEVKVEGDLASCDLAFGQAMLIPTSVGETKVFAGPSSAKILDIYLP
jgi:mannose-6-phosphate isomerase